MLRLISCLLKGHDWLLGRAAQSDAQLHVRQDVFHNRVCTYCGKEDLAADRAEEELQRINADYQRLNSSRRRNLDGKLDTNDSDKEY